MKEPFIIYNGKKRFLNLPSEINILTFADFKEGKKETDLKQLLKRAIENPIKSPKLQDMLSPSDKIAILVEDLTRPSPKRIILETLLEEIEEKINPPKGNISIIIALGTHRKLRENEFKNVFGEKLLSQYSVKNHNCFDADMVAVSKLNESRTVKINRQVAEADFKIGIGSILPHPMNGFGGGAKILFPGVADFDSIKEHHLQYTFHKGTALGRIDGNIFYERVTSIAKDAKLDFVINTIISQDDKVSDIVCGHPLYAHLAGIKMSKDIISQKFFKKSDLTVITSFPYSEGPQIVKPIIPASMITKEKGCIILVANCTSNLPDPFIDAFSKFHLKYGKSLFKAVKNYFKSNRLILEDGAIDFNMALGLTLATQDRFKMILVSDDIPKQKAEKMGFIYANNLDKAFEIGLKVCQGNTLNIVPAGGVILPVI